jgi:hypothetical protein
MNEIKNKIINNAIELVENILYEFPPDNDWYIVNLTLVPESEERKRISFEAPYDTIPAPFTYKNKQIISFLHHAGVFYFDPPCDEGWWSGTFQFDKKPKYAGLDIRYSEELMWSLVDHHALDITEKLRQINQLEKNHRVSIFSDIKAHDEHSITEYDLGPNLPGQYYALIFRSDAEYFLQFYKEQIPLIEKDCLAFLGHRVTFKGEVELATIKLLITKRNSIISKKEFYEAGGNDNYEQLTRIKGKTKFHDNLKKRFEAIREKIHKHKNLKAALIFVSKDGYGVFVNNAALVAPIPYRENEEIDDLLEEIKLKKSKPTGRIYKLSEI